MNNINSVVIGGNLAWDPELVGGGSVLRLRVAVNEDRKNRQTGEWEEKANFVDAVVFGNRAQALHQRLSKGMRVHVQGKLREDSWEAEDGSKRSKLEVIADEISFSPRGGAAPAAEYSVPAVPELSESDIPF